jgi:hypothetical protein
MLNHVWDLKYSVEDVQAGRFKELMEHSQADLAQSSIYAIEDSDYIRFFENEVSGTQPIEKIVHYVMTDAANTLLEFLTVREPVLARL